MFGHAKHGIAHVELRQQIVIMRVVVVTVHADGDGQVGLMRCVEPNDGQHIGGLENKKLVAEHAGFKEIARNGEKKWYRVFMQCLVIAGKRADAGWYNEITVAFLVRARWCAMPCSGDNDFSRKPPSNFVHNDNGYGSWSPWREFMRRAWVTCEQTSGVIASGPLQEATQDTSNVDGSTVITSLDTGGGRITCKGKFTIHGLSSDEENVFNEFQSKKFPE